MASTNKSDLREILRPSYYLVAFIDRRPSNLPSSTLRPVFDQPLLHAFN
uniref:Uncharacterized protein n=1 Tax=Picea glauca TaxID=3330 RepID=A0A101LYE8_PICGL|nr:hypothetical protein ABT39_MTgene5858 [Picea glauca]QHR92120.1 hypothetical protein Q903MT_gene6156 [Picea sitchensis]